MDYEKKYKDALERARNIYYSEETSAEVMIACENIFPEFEESEDEKIRKAIILFFELQDDNTTYSLIPKKDILAWLEKQGEQKPTDKVEPKFKVGDWVVNKFGVSWHIDSFDNKNYQVSDGKGNYNYFPISKQDEMHHWTIEDARNGDVLTSGNAIFIFNMIHDGWINCHCSFHKDGSFIVRDYDLMTIKYGKEVFPTTKEQRDIFFKAMTDAGYSGILLERIEEN